MKTISIFGSTGSIGKNTVEVILNDVNAFEIIALVAKSDLKTLVAQTKLLKPKYVVIEDESKFFDLKEALKDQKNIQILAGKEAIIEVAKIKCDVFVSAIMGFAGLLPTFEAIKSGSNIALANKESVVCAGNFLNEEAKKSGSKIFPVDSEHNAIFQIFEKDNLDKIESITLTASGGPFFNSDINFRDITVEQALKHPNWNMGSKISIDSATMMNKGLEMIEAYYLFPVKKEQIDILVHPQSILHGMVNYSDGSSLAMLSLPDMKVPISYALSHANRMPIKKEKFDLAKIKTLDFFDIDDKKFPSLKLCKQALKEEGSAPIILNASNEIAVEKFLKKEIRFDEITKIVEQALNKMNNKAPKSIFEVLQIDEDVRRG